MSTRYTRKAQGFGTVLMGHAARAVLNSDDGIFLIDYDARELDLTHGAAVPLWPNVGTAGSAWDLTATGTARPQYLADGGNGVPVVFFRNSLERVRMPASIVADWSSKFIVGFVVKTTITQSSCMFQWNPDAPTVFHNSAIQYLNQNIHVLGDGGSTVSAVQTTLGGWDAVAVDMTDPTNVLISVNGGLPVLAAGSIAPASTPNRVTIGTGFPIAWTWAGGTMGRLVFCNTDTDLQALSAGLKLDWNF